MTFDFGAYRPRRQDAEHRGRLDHRLGRRLHPRTGRGAPGKPIADGGVGYSCLAELRAAEALLSGEPKTPFLKAGDVVRIEMRDARRHTLFGAIEQAVRAP
jgi:fumarylacetoacetate (FAA) hydrolase